MGWRNRDEAEMRDFAKAWLAEERGKPISDQDVGQSVMIMNFMAPAKQQWLFIVQVIEEAQSGDELGALAAGPIEHLLGHHGDEYIEAVESLAGENDKFAETITGCWQYLMSDEVWGRVQAIQRAFEEKR